MKLLPYAAIVTACLSASSAFAACPQDAIKLGRILGQTFCDVTKDAYANSTIVTPHLYANFTLNKCSDGSSFDYRDKLVCKTAMANAVSRDRECLSIYRNGGQLNYGPMGNNTPAFIYEDFNQSCTL